MRIICKLPNASDLINGIKFIAHEAGKISEEVADEVGEALLAIPGYFIHDDAPAAPAIAPAQASGTVVAEFELDTLRTQIAADVAAEDAAAPAADAPVADVAAAEAAPAEAVADAPAAKAKRTAKAAAAE